jgi:L-ectoine synthase
MFVRNLEEIEKTNKYVEWGNGTSHRLLTASDGMGFAVCHTVVRAGTVSRLQYRSHLEACYCIEGEGEVEDMQGNVYRLRPGSIYVLNEHDEHYLRADPTKDMVLVSVFNPPLAGHERHNLGTDNGSSY